ncbi:FxLD family lanthipeptide [Actinomadura litoris]|uniref:FxLD family lanthipeptide n=1 Tax=Actinomadura litoris TaxID=2678616 RepID=UPI001FA7D040|nr:FxLD family lanthipeptide [Actinomadura litoris]
MSASIIGSPTTAPSIGEDGFALTVRVVTDDQSPSAETACDTSNGCASTCDSSCASAA